MSGSFGVAVDGNFNVGVFTTTGIGAGTNSAGIGISATGTNADSIFDTMGPGGGVGISTPYGSYNGVWGEDCEGNHTYGGMNVGYGIGFPEGHIEKTSTNLKGVNLPRLYSQIQNNIVNYFVGPAIEYGGFRY